MDIRTKLEVDDIDGYDWNWSGKYAREIEKDLVSAFSTAFVTELPTIPKETVQVIAAEWAEVHAANMMQAAALETKDRVRNLVQAGVMSRHPVGRIANMIRGDFIFSAIRAVRIARTETAQALGQGQKGAAIAQGRNEKRWVSVGDIDDVCQINEGMGWIPIADPFESGDDTIPAHPNCRCVVRYRTSEVHADFRCPQCKKLLGRSVHAGTRIMCRGCKQERTA